MEEENKKKYLCLIAFCSIARKYAIDLVIFVICALIVYVIKFTGFRFPLLFDWDYKNVNEILKFSCSTYCITFITLFVNSISKEWKKYINLYPHIEVILKRTLGVYSNRIGWLESVYKNITGGNTFSFQDKDFKLILDYYNQNPIDMDSFCRFNNGNASQIYFDMEALLRFSDCLDSELISTVYYIYTNTFILQNKGEQHKNLSHYSYMYDEERKLKRHYIKLKEQSVKIFGSRVLPKYLKY